MADIVWTVILGAIGSLIAASLYQFFGKTFQKQDQASLRLLDWAINILPNDLRERYQEEWLAHLCETSSTRRYFVALSFMQAAMSIRKVHATGAIVAMGLVSVRRVRQININGFSFMTVAIEKT